MATNTLLTIDQITNEALRVLHQEAVFIGKINRQYDDSFAKSGAKIGTALRIRKPIRPAVGSGAAITPSDTVEEYTTLTCATQKHVALSWTSVEMTMQLDDFSNRILKPAMSRLAAAMDADALSMYKNVYQQVGTAGATPATITTLLAGQQKLNEAAAPQDSRVGVMDPAANAALVAGLSGLFNASGKIGDQYIKGAMGSGTLGADWYMDYNVNSHTTGAVTTATGLTTTDVTTNASTTSVKFLTNAGTWVITAGDVFTIAGVYHVNPETGNAMGSLQQFVVVTGGTATTAGVAMTVDPPILSTGALKTVSAVPANGAVINFLSGSTAAVTPQNLLFHPDAFTFASADLQVPGGTDFAARKVFDGISLRIVRDYDISSDLFITRADVLYGYKCLRPELAVRITG